MTIWKATTISKDMMIDKKIISNDEYKDDIKKFAFYVIQTVIINEMYSLSLSYIDPNIKQLFSLSLKEIEAKKNTHYGMLIEKYGEDEALHIRRMANIISIDASSKCVKNILDDKGNEKTENKLAKYLLETNIYPIINDIINSDVK